MWLKQWRRKNSWYSYMLIVFAELFDVEKKSKDNSYCQFLVLMWLIIYIFLCFPNNQRKKLTVIFFRWLNNAWWLLPCPALGYLARMPRCIFSPPSSEKRYARQNLETDPAFAFLQVQILSSIVHEDNEILIDWEIDQIFLLPLLHTVVGIA